MEKSIDLNVHCKYGLQGDTFACFRKFKFGFVFFSYPTNVHVIFDSFTFYFITRAARISEQIKNLK